MASDPDDGGFRLEDEGDEPPAGTASPRPDVPPSPPMPRSFPVPAGTSAAERARRRDEGHEVSAVPVRERVDPASRSVHGALAPPPGWPREALRYPVRGRGVVSLAVAAAVVTAADLLTRSNAFLGAAAKVFLLAWLLAWQMRAAVATASGSDRPPRAFDGADFEVESLAALGGVVLRLLLYLLPAAFLYVKPYLADPRDGAHGAATWAAIVGFFVLALLLAPLALLGYATGNRRLTWPWGALPWLVRGWRACLVVTVGWAALAPAEAFVAWCPTASLGASFLACFALRLVSLHLLLVGARALGVLGRRFAT